MKQSIHDAFDTVSCDEVLKGRTCEYVIKHMHRSRKPAPRRMKWAVSLACLLLFATSGLGGYSLYYTEAAVISIDVNPSIELDINRWGKVVNQTTYGEESKTVLQSLSLKHLEYEEALALLLASDAMQQYLKKDTLVSITLETKDGDPQMFSSLQECVNTALMQCHGVKAEYASVDSHMCEEAHEHGMSLGKYYAIQELLTADPQATLDEFKDKSMKEIKVHTEHCEHRQQRIRGELQGQSQAESSQAESQEEFQAESSQADFQGESQADFQDKFLDNSIQPAERSHSQTDSQETGWQPASQPPELDFPYIFSRNACHSRVVRHIPDHDGSRSHSGLRSNPDSIYDGAANSQKSFPSHNRMTCHGDLGTDIHKVLHHTVVLNICLSIYDAACSYGCIGVYDGVRVYGAAFCYPG